MCLALNDHESVELVMYGRPLMGWDINVVMDYLQAAYEVRVGVEAAIPPQPFRCQSRHMHNRCRGRSSTKSRWRPA